MDHHEDLSGSGPAETGDQRGIPGGGRLPDRTASAWGIYPCTGDEEASSSGEAGEEVGCRCDAGAHGG